VDPRPHPQNPHLPSQHQRALRSCAGGSAEGVDPLLPTYPLRRCQTLRLLDHGELPRGLRVEMQWRMLQQEGPPEDFEIATGRQESVRRFIELSAIELSWGAIQWQG
jgi:hypothetical protein